MSETTKRTISTAEVSSAIKEALTGYNQDVQDVIKKQTDVAAKELKTLIQSAAPKRRPKYSLSWHVKCTQNTSFRYSKTVYSYKEYSLTHLLEDGHALIRGGRTIGKTKAYKHIAPSSEKIKKSYIENVQNEILKLS